MSKPKCYLISGVSKFRTANFQLRFLHRFQLAMSLVWFEPAFPEFLEDEEWCVHNAVLQFPMAPTLLPVIFSDIKIVMAIAHRNFIRKSYKQAVISLDDLRTWKLMLLNPARAACAASYKLLMSRVTLSFLSSNVESLQRQNHFVKTEKESVWWTILKFIFWSFCKLWVFLW